MFVRDDETDALLRAATAYAALDNWGDALAALLEARGRMMVSPVHYPIDTWCKYPLYLSRAGRFDESMKAFDWLLEDLPRRAKKESFMDDPNVSFGKGTTKRSIYASIVKTAKTGIERNRAVALRRMEKALKKASDSGP